MESRREVVSGGVRRYGSARIATVTHASAAIVAALLLSACSGGAHESTASNEAATSAPTCAASLAVGAVPAYHKALLDTIAFTEGTAGHEEDGYNITYAYRVFNNCDHHPNIEVCSGGWCSTAAGRYQFLTETWNGLGLPNFHPDNQDRGAMGLITNKRGVQVPSDRPLTQAEFSAAMDSLSWEWASLPPSRYGQPIVDLATVRAKYCSFAGCDGQQGTVPPGGGGGGGNTDCSVHADHKLWCTNHEAKMYASPRPSSVVVDELKSPYSWFECWGTGAWHGGGNATWYRTVGDVHGLRGWVAAVNLYTPDSFDSDPSAHGLAKCQ